MSLPIVINGALGKMGVEIAGIILADEEAALAGAVERAGHPRTGDDYGLCMGRGEIGVPLNDTIDPITHGVIIDFSSPASTRAVVAAARMKNLPIVVGTTGLAADDLAALEEAAAAVPLLVSPNMSLGVNILFHLTDLVSRKLKDRFDIEIIEAHHRFKKDAPSGTARRLGEIAATALGLSYEEAVRDGRSGMTSSDRSRTEIGMHAVRGGDIVGDHTVLFAGMGERIELRHQAQSRSVLAEGAVTAAKWISRQKPGLYSMADLLGLH